MPKQNVTETNDGVFTRTALVLKRDENDSVDIVDDEGRLLMRLNVFNHGKSASIDVIFDLLKTSTQYVQSWDHGELVLRARVTGSLISVSHSR